MVDIKQQWYCSSCKAHNDILDLTCRYYFELCQTYRPIPLEKFAGWISLKRRGDLVDVKYPDQTRLPGEQRMRHTEKELEELHARFFNNESTVVVPNMDLAQLEEHIHELEMIAFEAKVRIQSATANKRERVAKLRQSERDRLISNPGISGSDALATIAARKENLNTADKKAKLRQTKADKAVESLAALGMSSEEIAKILGKAKVAEPKEKTPTPKPTPSFTEVNREQAEARMNRELVKEAIEVISDKPKVSTEPNLGFFKFGK